MACWQESELDGRGGETYQKPLGPDVGHGSDVLLGREDKLVVDDPVIGARHNGAGVDHEELVVLDSVAMDQLEYRISRIGGLERRFLHPVKVAEDMRVHPARVDGEHLQSMLLQMIVNQL